MKSKIIDRLLLKTIQTTVVGVYPSTTDKVLKYIDDYYKLRFFQIVSLFYHPKPRVRMYVKGDGDES